MSRKGLSPLWTGIIIFVIGVSAVGVFAFVQQQGQQQAAVVTAAQGFFDSVGTVNATDDDLVDLKSVTFTDEDQTDAGGANISYRETAVANETVQTASDASDNGFISLNNDDLDAGRETVWNQTGNEKFGSGYYTLNASAGTIDLNGTLEASNTKITIDYDYMQTQNTKEEAKLSFTIDEGVNGFIINHDYGTGRVSNDNTDMLEAEIVTQDEGNTVVDLPESSLEAGDEQEINKRLPAGDYYLRLAFEHDQFVPNFTPNPAAGTTQVHSEIDMELMSKASQNPVEFKNYAINVETLAP